MAKTTFIPSFDGANLAVHRLGQGRPVLLLHGLFSSADMNWIRYGHAQKLADAGFEAIMPDLRAHGKSDAPRESAAYPPDVLVQDVRALVMAMELEDYDLVGFSLGARTAARGVVEGLRPRRLVLAGMGIEGLDNWERRAAFFVDMLERFETIERGDPAFFAYSFFKSMKMDREAASLLLGAVDDIGREDLARIAMPTLVLCGDEDRDNGDPVALADALPDAEFEEIPGTHMGCVTKPQLGRAIASFLSA